MLRSIQNLRSDDGRLLTIEETADLLGMSCSRVDQLSLYNPAFPRAMRLGRTRLWLEHEVAAWRQAALAKLVAPVAPAPAAPADVAGLMS